MSQQLQSQSQPDSTTTPRPRTMSVVIPAYNSLPLLMRCLKSLYATAFNYGTQGRMEILVQDDCSTEYNATEVLYGEPCKVERNAQNLGFAGNCNAGAKRAAGDVLLFLNQDTMAKPEWFEPLLEPFDLDVVGIVGPKLTQIIYHKDGTPSFEVIQSCGGLYGGNKGPFHRMLGWAANDWRVNVYGEVSWTTGAALAIRRDLFWRVGGFDVGYVRGYFEDVDLCEAVKAQGYAIWYQPRSVFVHNAGSSGGIPAEIFRRNSFRFHDKWDAKIKPDTPIVHVNY